MDTKGVQWALSSLTGSPDPTQTNHVRVCKYKDKKRTFFLWLLR
jgi:hypothetical protein